MKGFIRPESVVLGESSIVTAKNRMKRKPTRFSHVTARPVPYRLDANAAPAGEMPAGVRVLMLKNDEAGSWVVTRDGLCVCVERDALERLPREG